MSASSCLEFHSIALKADPGNLWAWGNNADGQLGVGGTSQVLVPARVQALSNVRVVKTGPRHSLALTADGLVSSWGANSNGQLGIGTNTSVSIRIQVPGLTGVVAILAGAQHSLAVTADGVMKGFGDNTYGQLGTGLPLVRLSPIQVL
ncbi:RCC1 domain-containing protein [Corallococcus terminator]